MKIDREWLLRIVIGTTSIAHTNAAIAQIIPDRTLPTNSVVSTGGNIKNITGGSRAGNNLFHSFQQFSIPTGETAFFQNAAAIQNIFSRVTGNSISNINGIIKANGEANLFLINPSGIIFGKNAALDIGGSFFASTASEIHFADQTKFSATHLQTSPLLTISAPIGLGFDSTSRNTGNIINLSQASTLTPNPDPSQPPISTIIGLQVKPNRTLAILGGEVILDGGYLTAPKGRIEVGAVENNTNNTQVSLTPVNDGFTLGYGGVSNFRDVQVSNLSRIDASGEGGGNIQIQAQNLRVTGGSRVLANTLGSFPGGNLVINVGDLLEVSGTGTLEEPKDPLLSSLGFLVPIQTLIATQSFSSGSAGNLTVNAKKVLVTGGGGIKVENFSTGKGGKAVLTATESVELAGAAPIVGISRSASTINAAILRLTGFSLNLLSDVGTASTISTSSISPEAGGDLTLTTNKLMLSSGAQIGSNVFDTGAGGTVTIFAKHIDLSGVSRSGELSTRIVATNFNTGNSGDVLINSDRLTLRDGGAISTATFTPGLGGRLTIRATNAVDLIGVSRNGIPSNLSASTTGAGNAGNVRITTGNLSIRDGAEITVSATKEGIAGNLQVFANTISLDNQASINAATTTGTGANISLQSQNIQLRHASLITASASNTANGGNLAIDTNTLATLEGSNITASAIQGNGGNIQINTQALFRSDASVISASSLLGIDGILEIKTPELNLQNSLAPIAITFTNPNSLIADSCLTRRNAGKGSFVITGTGGLPRSPYDDKVASRYYVADLQGQSVNSEIESIQDHHSNISNQVQADIPISNYTSQKAKYPIQEAQSLTVSPAGRILLTTLPQQGNINSANLVCP